MNQKKCPKCGENNPPEAVMCWACYTPLSGSGAVAATASAAGLGAAAKGRSSKTAAPSPYEDSAPKKKAAEPWQLGVIGVGLLVAVFLGGRALMGGGSGSVAFEEGGDYASPAATPNTSGGSSSPSSGPASAPIVTGGASPIMAAQSSSPSQLLFTISVPPRRNVSWPSMAIVPTSSNVNASTAASLAAAARQQTMGSGRWDGIYIYVFADQDTSQKFREYQTDREGRPLGNGDFQALRAIWPKTLVRYEYSRGFEAVRYPAQNPGAWWYGSSKYAKVVH